MLFRIIDIAQQARKGKEDPRGLFRDQLKGALIELVIGPILGLVLFLAFLFVLSYTHLLGGPYGLARFFFWLLAVIYASVGYGFYKLYQSLRKTFSQKNSHAAPAASGSVRDAEIVE